MDDSREALDKNPFRSCFKLLREEWCATRGILHLTGAPYHLASNGAAERLVQTFKQSMRKSTKPPATALQEFLMMYRRTPNASGFSPSELLNGRKIRTAIDILCPDPAVVMQRQQSERLQQEIQRHRKIQVHQVHYPYTVGTPCFVLTYGHKKDREPRWVLAVIVRINGPRSYQVQVVPNGPIWKRHIEQLSPRYGVDQDDDPGDDFTGSSIQDTSVSTQQTTTHGGIRRSRRPRRVRAKITPRRTTRPNKPKAPCTSC